MPQLCYPAHHANSGGARGAALRVPKPLRQPLLARRTFLGGHGRFGPLEVNNHKPPKMDSLADGLPQAVKEFIREFYSAIKVGRLYGALGRPRPWPWPAQTTRDQRPLGLAGLQPRPSCPAGPALGGPQPAPPRRCCAGGALWPLWLLLARAPLS